MYQTHFQLKQAPFSIAPDPSFLYLSDGHSEALAHLMYGFSHGGFVLITGEVGTGKTTLLRNLIKQTPADLDVAFVLNPRLTVKELLETVCDELGVTYPTDGDPTIKQYIDVLNQHLLRTHLAGRSTVMIIDEAQNLSPAVLEQIRLLTNLETDDRKLLRIILLGQPELDTLLERSELRQLAQRITARYHLGSLTREDCYAYVVHRLTRAGGSAKIFSRHALARLFRVSKGIPRVINVVADRALLGAYVEGKNQVSGRIVNRATREVLGKRPLLWRWLAAGVISASAVSAAFAYFYQAVPDSPTPPIAATGVALPVPSEPLVVDVPSAREVPADQPTPAPIETARIPAPVEELAPLSQPSIGQPPISRPDMSSHDSQRRAYEAAFAAWGADYANAPASTIPCNFAPTAGLQCLGVHGSWSDVTQQNLPVVLELWDNQPGPFYAGLTRRQGDTLILQVGDESVTVTPRALREVWYGQYVLLWQTPPSYHGNIKAGDTHPTVGWLRDQLSGLVQQPLQTPNPEYFDADLESAVREFQDTEGLLTDGIVGPATWIRVAARLNLPAPSLDG
jgi:general secretion pathway protein A